MLDKRSKEKLEALVPLRRRNLARHIYIIHRRFHEWACKKWIKDGWGVIRPDHLRLLSIIGAEELNNNELAQRARVSKQAMSKMVTELQKRGFIVVEPDPSDSRAKVISVSKKGVDFLYYLNTSAKELEVTFAEIVGKQKTEQLIKILGELTDGMLARENDSYLQKPGK